MSLAALARTVIDRCGAVWSLLCAVHCAALPVVLVFSPGLVLGGWWDEGIERVVVTVVSVVALLSLSLGWRRHRGRMALVLGVPGLLCMWAALLVPQVHESVPAHALAMACGGVLVGLAHLCNLRLDAVHVHGPGCTHPMPPC